MKRCRVLLFAMLLPLFACGEGERERKCATLFGGGSYCLQPTTALAPFDAQQKVEASFRGRRETMIVEIENDADSLRFVGLTPFGHKLIQVSYDNRVASAATLPDQRLSPALLIALLQIALWPTDAVRAGLEAPLTLEEDAKGRRILNGGELTLSIEHNGEHPPWRQMQLTIHSAGLELSIEALPKMDKEQ